MHGVIVNAVVRLHAVIGHVGQFVTVLPAPDADVTLHFGHKTRVVRRHMFQLFVGNVFKNSAFDASVVQENVRLSACRIHRVHKRVHKRNVDAESVDPDLFALLNAYRIFHKILCQQFLSFI